ncbi:MAG: twin transmembrane helix small protein [Rickettsiales bacterium]|nr:twin transmembrane helix small protein [Rickettsiales bacterium]
MSPLIILMFVFMVLTVLALGLGLFGMATGGEFNKKYANKLMSLRVYMQGAAIVLLGLMFLLK